MPSTSSFRGNRDWSRLTEISEVGQDCLVGRRSFGEIATLMRLKQEILISWWIIHQLRTLEVALASAEDDSRLSFIVDPSSLSRRRFNRCQKLSDFFVFAFFTARRSLSVADTLRWLNREAKDKCRWVIQTKSSFATFHPKIFRIKKPFRSGSDSNWHQSGLGLAFWPSESTFFIFSLLPSCRHVSLLINDVLFNFARVCERYHSSDESNERRF